MARPADERRYRLPADHAGVLVDADDPAHVAPFADMIVGVAQALDEVVDAYRSGAGVPFARYGAALRRGQGGVNRPAFHAELTGSWLPAAADVHARLSRPGTRIADVGCGHGWSTIALGRAYPHAEVVGYDADGASIVEAREHVAAEFTAPGDLTERIMYGWSISHCLPAAMAEQPSAALGTVLREDTVRSLAPRPGSAAPRSSMSTPGSSASTAWRAGG